MNNNRPKTRSPSSRVSINSDKVRSIREVKGLTQLYIATELGVTTDTVSRWENRRYPTIKWENAEKLARALETDVHEILDGPAEISADVNTDGTAVDSPPRQRHGARIAVLAATLTLLVTGLLMAAFMLGRPEDIVVTRFLPQHAPVGQVFPVIIRVQSEGEIAFSFILEETLPSDCIAVKGVPPFINPQGKGHRIKWICNSRRSPYYLAYLVKTGSAVAMTDTLNFSGFIKIDRMPDVVQRIMGNASVRISNHHWADSNEDGRIDDVEILAVYNSFEALQNLGVDLQQVKDIWSGKGYQWNPEKQTYTVIGQ